MTKRLKFFLIIMLISISSIYANDFNEPLWHVAYIFEGFEPTQGDWLESGGEAERSQRMEKYNIRMANLISQTNGGEHEKIVNYLKQNYDTEEVKSYIGFIERKIETDKTATDSDDIDLAISLKQRGGKFILIGVGAEAPVQLEIEDTRKSSKDLYMLTAILKSKNDEALKTAINYVQNVADQRAKLWNEYFENVKKPQYPWEEVFNDWRNSVKEDGFIIKEPNETQVVLLHPTVMLDTNDDEMRPSLGLEVLGFRKHDKDTGYRDNWGLSLLVSANDKSEDDYGVGVVLNWNDTKVGVLYRDTDRDVSKWWLTFGIELARFTQMNSIGEINRDKIKNPPATQ